MRGWPQRGDRAWRLYVVQMPGGGSRRPTNGVEDTSLPFSFSLYSLLRKVPSNSGTSGKVLYLGYL